MADETREERIRIRAHELWEKEGKPEGADLRFWEQAMGEIDEEDQRNDRSKQPAGQ